MRTEQKTVASVLNGRSATHDITHVATFEMCHFLVSLWYFYRSALARKNLSHWLNTAVASGTVCKLKGD